MQDILSWIPIWEYMWVLHKAYSIPPPHFLRRYVELTIIRQHGGDICQATKLRGKHPPLFTDTKTKPVDSQHQIEGKLAGKIQKGAD